MNIVFSYIVSLLKKHGVQDLNAISANIFSGNYTVQEATLIYQLSLKDLEYVADCVNKYYEHAHYIQERTGGYIK